MGLLGCGSLDPAGADWPGTGSKPYRNQSLRPGHPSWHPQDSSQEVLASPCFLFLWRAFASLMDETIRIWSSLGGMGNAGRPQALAGTQLKPSPVGTC